MTGTLLMMTRPSGGPPPAMATFVGAWAGPKADPLPAFVPGDLGIVCMPNFGNNTTPPDLLPGWTNIGTSANTTINRQIAGRIQYRVLQSGDDMSAAASGARVSGIILRGVDGSNIVEWESNEDSSSGVAFPALALDTLDCVVLMAASRNDFDWVMPAGITKHAQKGVGTGAPIPVVGSAKVMSFDGATATQPATTSGHVAYTIGIA